MKTQFSASCLFALAVLASTVSVGYADLARYRNEVQSQASLISYYTFDSADASDSKSSNHGTTAGTVRFDPGIGGGTNQAVVLQGLGHVNLGPVEAFDFASGTGSVEAWIRADWATSPGYNPTLFADRDGGPVNWSIHLNADKKAGGLWNGSTYSPLTLSAVGTNWHHLVVVFEVDDWTLESTFSLYWDGELMGATLQGLGPNPEAPTELGSCSVGGQEQWIGALDEVAFYSEALSAAVVKSHYLALLAGDPPVILTQPKGGVFLTGVSLLLSVDVKGADLAYQWFHDSIAIASATSATLTLAPLAATHTGAYHVVVTNLGGRATSEVVQVQLGSLPAKLAQYRAAVQTESSLISLYTFDALNPEDAVDSHPGTPQGKVSYDDGIGGGAGKAVMLNGAGHINLGVVDAFQFATGIGTVEAWIRADWTPGLGYNPTIFANRDGNPVTWSIHMNDFKEVVGMWNGWSYQPQPTPGTGTGWHHLAAVFNVDSISGDPSFTLYWDGIAAGSAVQGVGSGFALPIELGSCSAVGQERWVGALDEVAFYSEALSADAIQAHYSAFVAGSPPVITQQPRGASLFVGSPLTLSVGASGLDLTYQWYKNGVPMGGEVSANLVFSALQASDGATYRVRVTNAAGFQDSEAAVVTVIVPDLAAYQQRVQHESSLISYYTFDTGDASDSKTNNHGWAIDQVSYGTGVGGGTDQALALDGNGHVDLGYVSAFDFSSGKGTVEAWIRADWTSGPGYNPALFADRDGNAVNWSIHMNAGKEAAGLWNGSFYQPLTTANTGVAWHHLAVVFDVDSDSGSSLFTLYWDGAPVGTTHQGLGPAPDSPTELGSASVMGQERWIGRLDEVAFYSDALKAATIKNHYQALIGAPVEPPTLTCTRLGTKVTISWPAEAIGFTLESSASLPATSWAVVAGVVNNTVTLESSSGAQFFRLKH